MNKWICKDCEIQFDFQIDQCDNCGSKKIEKY